MLKFVFRKMLSKKWMILSLLIGNIFLISIAMSGPAEQLRNDDSIRKAYLGE